MLNSARVDVGADRRRVDLARQVREKFFAVLREQIVAHAAQGAERVAHRRFDDLRGEQNADS